MNMEDWVNDQLYHAPDLGSSGVLIKDTTQGKARYFWCHAFGEDEISELAGKEIMTMVARRTE